MSTNRPQDTKSSQYIPLAVEFCQTLSVETMLLIVESVRLILVRVRLCWTLSSFRVIASQLDLLEFVEQKSCETPPNHHDGVDQ